jgi:ribosomal protein S18 acetylase RimI-like enzyme
MGYESRAATNEDYAFLYHLHVATMKDYVDQTWGWEDGFQQARFEASFDPSRQQILVADGRDVGVLSVVRQKTEVFLSFIKILAEYQGRGLGTSVIKDIISEASSIGLPVVLQVLKVNPAQRLYERLGFGVVGETDTHYLMRTT